MRLTRRTRSLLAGLLTVLLLGGCADAVTGTGTVGPANLSIQGYSGSSFDEQARDALSDVIGFWTVNFPKIAGGKQLPPLQGKLYSVDGAAVVSTGKAPADARSNACLERKLSFIVDNAAYCQLDDSIVWDRSPGHLLPVLTDSYGRTLTALVFAHEFGHAIQHRLGIDKQDVPTIYVEQQADCAAGAFIAAALNGGAPHFHMSTSDLDQALAGYFQVRDTTPDSAEGISHGNGFDRLNALQQGVKGGVTYCYSKQFFATRKITERSYANDSSYDYAQQGNEPLSDVLLQKGGIADDLNRFWTIAGKTVKKTLQPVKLAEADHPKCGAATAGSQFGYCPDDNTVYYSKSFAEQAYYSIVTPEIDRQTARVTLAPHQPGDYALGQLLAIAWGMAAEHQFFGTSVTDEKGLIAAICYSGAYAADINRENPDSAHPFVLSPPDMDEATSATISLVPLDQAFGARGTDALQRVQSFVTGYSSGLHGC